MPLLVWSKGRIAPRQTDALVQWMDIASTVLESAGVEIPRTFESRSLWPILDGKADAIRTEAWSELARDHIQTGAEYIVMRRDARWKVVCYLGAADGELYDLQEDPGELVNLWDAPPHRERRASMVREVLEWSVRSMIASRQPPAAKPQQPMRIQEKTP